MMTDPVLSYKDLIVWQKSVNLATQIYEISEKFPKSELFNLTSQIRRASSSIPSNIAEGRMRGTRKDYRHFLFNAYGSGAELETQICIVKTLSFGKNLNFEGITSDLEEVMKMLNKMINTLKS